MAHHGRYGMKRLIAGLMIGAATLTLSVAQDSWSTHRGSNQRTGTTTNAQSSVINFLLAWTLPDIDSVRLPATDCGVDDRRSDAHAQRRAG
jgi:hypothetical protein